MGESKAHPNNMHCCDAHLVEFSQYRKSLAEVLSHADFTSVYDFFVLHAPILKSAEIENEFGQRSLRFYNWISNPQMNRLERELLRTAGLSSFIMLKSDTIIETLQAMQLRETGCTEHPRAVLQQNFVVKILEDGTIQVINDETRMQCLFRHVRNALAHNRTFSLPNSMIMLQDEDGKSKKITARLLLPAAALSQWITVIKENSTKSGGTSL